MSVNTREFGEPAELPEGRPHPRQDVEVTAPPTGQTDVTQARCFALFP